MLWSYKRRPVRQKVAAPDLVRREWRDVQEERHFGQNPLVGWIME